MMNKKIFISIFFWVLLISGVSFSSVSKPLENIVIFVDSGHGPLDPGGSGIEGDEWEYNLITTMDLMGRLTEFGADVRGTNLVVEAGKRVKEIHKEIKKEMKKDPNFANKKILFISIHHNTTGGEGSEVYFGSEKDPLKIERKENPTRIRLSDDIAMSEKLVKELEKIGFENRGAKPARDSKSGQLFISFLDKKIESACLVEIAFIDNQSDVDKINSLGRKIDRGLLVGILRYFDLVKSLFVEAEAQENTLTKCKRENGLVKIGKDPVGVPKFDMLWGGWGSGPGQFKAISSLGVDSSDDSVYVTDFDNDRIQKFTSDGGFITAWGGFGFGSGQFDDPWGIGIAVDSSGDIYVSDNGNCRIQKFTRDGTFITARGSPGSGDGQFYWPTDVFVDVSSNVYVADQGNHRIQKFTSDGTFITKWGSFGSGDGQFKCPACITGDSSGNIYVSDRCANHRIQKFTSDGAFITKWGSYGSGNGQFKIPEGITVDSSDYVYVTERANYRVQKFTSEGVFLTKWGSYGWNPGQFKYPIDVGLDSEDNIYVADGLTNYVQKFTQPGATEGIVETDWIVFTELFSYIGFIPTSFIPSVPGTQTITYEYSTDDVNWYPIPDGLDMMAVDVSPKQIKCRITLARVDPEDESPSLDKIEIEYVGSRSSVTTTAGANPSASGSSSRSVQASMSSEEEEFELGEIYAYPNPARMKNPTIHIEAGRADKVEIKIYNIAGDIVHQVTLSHQPSIINGKYAYEYSWDSSNVASGVYIYFVRVSKDGEEDIKVIKKLALLK